MKILISTIVIIFIITGVSILLLKIENDAVNEIVYFILGALPYYVALRMSLKKAE